MAQRIGQYEVLERIGHGGMGAVYKARDPRFDRLVAIKVLHQQLLWEPGIVERFKAEAVIQAKLSHPNIVTVFDFIAEENLLAMVMEFINGKPLNQVIEGERKPMEPERAARITGQVLRALGHAHKQGLIHRDVKPSNILVQSIDGEEMARLTDFGIAKILGAEKKETLTAASMGTLSYMPPEQVKSAKYVDRRSDIYSVGVTLYEMLTGSVPFDAESAHELGEKILKQPMPDPRSFARSLDSRMVGVLEKALAKKPEERFQTCEEFREALGQALTPAPAPQPRHQAMSYTTPAPALSPAPAPERLQRRKPDAAAPVAIGIGVAAIAIAVLIGGLWLSKQTERTGMESNSAEERAQAEPPASSDDVWIDPSTNLMWAEHDNGSDVNWQQAKQYCESLTLGGYSDWRLPAVGQLEGLYDWPRGASGRYIKSPLTLTGWWAWSSEMRDSSSAWYFAFSGGGRLWGGLGYSDGGRALCVQGPGR